MYQTLHYFETEVMRRKLQDTEHKKLILEDEIRFLRQRYKYLLKHRIPKPQPKKEVVKSQKVKIQAPIISKGKNYSRKDHTSRSHSSSHLNPNGKISNVAEFSPVLGGVMQREEEELQGNSEPMRIEEPKRSTQRVGSDEQHNIKLSACRSVGDGANRAGKRKISWQRHQS
ncbi:hypothetical protein V8G54_020004, partial [Vigna mungo]